MLRACRRTGRRSRETWLRVRSEEHTSELQSPCNLVCRLLLEKKKKTCHLRSTSILERTHSSKRRISVSRYDDVDGLAVVENVCRNIGRRRSNLCSVRHSQYLY